MRSAMVITIHDHQAVSWNVLYSQSHWTKRYELAQTIHTYMIASLPPGWKRFDETVDISITAYFKDSRLRDSDNVASKLYIDGLKGRLILDDDTRFVRRVTTEIVNKAGEDKLVIKIKSVQEEGGDDNGEE